MGRLTGGKIMEVDPGSIGAELDLEPGDILRKINDTEIRDLIDYLMLSAESEIKLEVIKKSGELHQIEFEKDPEEPFGLTFEDDIFDGLKTCSNHCIFCFVHQLPAKQRPSLYVRDDDYRLSFLQGSYITLTNLTEQDWRRIEKWRLSPLYISVHATQPDIRQKILGSKDAVSIVDQLRRLGNAGITLHTQAVICPGLNDGSVLEATITELAAIWPAVASLAVVPVGLTKNRRNLFPLKPFTKEESIPVIDIIECFQDHFLEKFGTRFVFAADEWYIAAGQDFPDDVEYEDYYQLDNGVGLIRRFLTQFKVAFGENLLKLQKIRQKMVVVTGKATARLWREVLDNVKRYCPEMEIEVLQVTNGFFGSSVTVTGLLVGADIIAAIDTHQANSGAVYLIPQITLKRDQDLFLDGVSVAELKTACRPKRIEVVPADAAQWVNWIINYFT